MPLIMEGTPPLTGRALPNLINAVRMLKSKSTCLSRRKPKPHCFDLDFDFKILTAFIRLGRAGPVGAGCPP